MDKEFIVLIITGALTLFQTGSWVGIAALLIKFIGKKVEDSTGLKAEVSKLNKKLYELVEEDEELKNKCEQIMLEMKGFVEYGDVGKNDSSEE